MDTMDKQYVIFLDIDGTLMGGSDIALKRNLDVIGKVRSLGHKVLVNTGRSTAFLPSHIDFERHFDGVVTGAGARIIFENKEIFCKLMDIDDIRKFCELSFKQENLTVLEGVDCMLCIGGENERHPEWILLNEQNAGKLLTDDLKIEKFTVLGTASEKIPVMLGEGYTVIQHTGYAEIIKKEYSKSGAVKVVMDYLGLPHKQSIAMGDSLNDFDMIEHAGIGVAMGNAVPEIKDIADMVTENVDDAGVAAALEKIFKLSEW